MKRCDVEEHEKSVQRKRGKADHTIILAIILLFNQAYYYNPYQNSNNFDSTVIYAMKLHAFKMNLRQSRNYLV